MARPAFYDSPAYRAKQSAITKRNQERGIYKHLDKRETRTCARKGCGNPFIAEAHDSKRFCGQSCAAKVSNKKRGPKSDETRKKISEKLKGRSHVGFVNPFKGIIKVPREERVCENSLCSKVFLVERWRRKRFCNSLCAMRVIGGRPTSPKASRGKAGVRPDVSDSIYFYSRWEANIARLYTFLKISWEYSPRTFDIGKQNYTPDFYLPDRNVYVEIKNFWGEYSKRRDEKFRRAYPDVQLEVLLKDEYLALEKQYAHLIPNWEYNNSPVPWVT